MTSSACDRLVIRYLIAVAADCVREYCCARDNAVGSAFVALLDERIIERKAIIAALCAALETRGGEPEASSTVSGNARPIYANLLAAIASHDDREIINQIGLIEDAIVYIFREAMNDPAISLETSGVIRECFVIIKHARDRISDIEYAISDAYRGESCAPGRHQGV